MDNNQNDAMLEYYATLGAQQPGKEALTRQQRNIDYLRKTTQAPQGSYTQPSNGQPAIYVRPNALSQIASVAGQGLAGYQQGTHDIQAQQYGDEGVQAFQGMLKRLRASKGGMDGAQPSPMQNAGGYEDQGF